MTQSLLTTASQCSYFHCFLPTPEVQMALNGEMVKGNIVPLEVKSTNLNWSDSKYIKIDVKEFFRNKMAK